MSSSVLPGISTNIRNYYLGEWEAARNPEHPSHVLPQIERVETVLDIGCGCGFPEGTFRNAKVVGIDISSDPFIVAREEELKTQTIFAVANGEALPFEDGSFDAITMRVSIAYMRIPTAIREMERVLKPGGQIWLVLHDFSKTLRNVQRAFIKGRPQGVVFQGYVLMNSIVFHYFGKQFNFPWTSKLESFQTDRGMRRELSRCGFADIKILRDSHYVLTAVKR